jgi:hypothetical protein
MPGKFVLQKSGKGFHWNLLATNGKVVATSQHYATRRAAMAGIASVRKHAPDAPVVDGDEVPARTAAARLAAQRVGKSVAHTVADKAKTVAGSAKTVTDKVAAIKGS